MNAVGGTNPPQWEQRRLKTLCSMKSGSAISSDDIEARGTYPVFGGNGIRGWTETFTHDGTFPLVGRQGARCGNVHLATGRFWPSEHAVVVTPARGVNAAWLARALREMNLGQYSQAAAQPGLAVERIRVLPVPTPDQTEQRLIARFLDHVDLRVGRSIFAKRRLVALLDERRHVISQRLVTKGLEHERPRRVTGLTYLPEVPSHWDVRRAKWFYTEVNERSARGDEQLLSVSHLTGVTPRASKVISMFMAQSYAGHKLCRAGDLVVNTMWAWMGALGVAPNTGIVSPAYGVYRPLAGSALLPEYADLLLRTRPYVDEYTSRSTGIRSSRLRLYPDKFLDIPIACPPIEEQRAIVARASAMTLGLSGAIEASLREVDLLNKYRDRLTADVLAGSRDVRDRAAVLPEVDPEELAAATGAHSWDDDGQEEADELDSHAV
jgi:type I restriction enzyme S subunit